jgi:starch synthase
MHFGPAHGIPTVITVHNLAFQGRYPAGIFGGLGLPGHAMTVDGVEYYGGVGYLKAGSAVGLGNHDSERRPMPRK